MIGSACEQGNRSLESTPCESGLFDDIHYAPLTRQKPAQTDG
jgi:hypothetical protein